MSPRCVALDENCMQRGPAALLRKRLALIGCINAVGGIACANKSTVWCAVCLCSDGAARIRAGLRFISARTANSKWEPRLEWSDPEMLSHNSNHDYIKRGNNSETPSLKLVNYVFKCSTVAFIPLCSLPSISTEMYSFGPLQPNLRPNSPLILKSILIYAYSCWIRRTPARSTVTAGSSVTGTDSRNTSFSGASVFKTTTNLTVILCEIPHCVWCNAFQNWLRFIGFVLYLQS